jgi:hypothetical protein
MTPGRFDRRETNAPMKEKTRAAKQAKKEMSVEKAVQPNNRETEDRGASTNERTIVSLKLRAH